MTLDQFMDIFKSENPNLVKPTGKSGGATGGGTLTAAQLTERGQLEAKIEEAEKLYRETRDNKYLRQHRDLSNKLKTLTAGA
jgi:hypothetical protein